MGGCGQRWYRAVLPVLWSTLYSAQLLEAVPLRVVHWAERQNGPVQVLDSVHVSFAASSGNSLLTGWLPLIATLREGRLLITPPVIGYSVQIGITHSLWRFLPVSSWIAGISASFDTLKSFWPYLEAINLQIRNACKGFREITSEQHLEVQYNQKPVGEREIWIPSSLPWQVSRRKHWVQSNGLFPHYYSNSKSDKSRSLNFSWIANWSWWKLYCATDAKFLFIACKLSSGSTMYLTVIECYQWVQIRVTSVVGSGNFSS